MLKRTSPGPPNNPHLMKLLLSIADGDNAAVSQILGKQPDLARQAIAHGASRAESEKFFLKQIMQYLNQGDTALHVASAAYDIEAAKRLIACGAGIDARNRFGAAPIHSASCGSPEAHNWNPEKQSAIITYLLEVGAAPDAVDKRGVSALHRAVRGRCTAAVEALLTAGASPRLKNGNGSTPLHLAVQNTGRGGTGLPASKENQRKIIELLLRYGADIGDRDERGRSVPECAPVSLADLFV